MRLLTPAAALLLLLTAGSAVAASPDDTTPGGSAAVGFPLALVVLAVVATVLALVWRAVAKRREARAPRS